MIKFRIKNLESRIKGFTLIELLFVFSIVGILSGIGIASFTTFNRTQTLNQGTSDVASMLNRAKSKSASQIKPTQCGTQPLNGYQVAVTTPRTYTLSAVCGGSVSSPVLESKSLSSQISFSGSTSVRFGVSSGTIASPVSISITNGSVVSVINVDVSGNIAY